MTRISTYSSTGDKPHRINDKMTAAFVKAEENCKGTGRGLLGLAQLITGIVYPLFKALGALLPLPIAGLKRRYVWLKEAKSGLSYVGHGLANMGVGLLSIIPCVNAARFKHIEYAHEPRNSVLNNDYERLLEQHLKENGERESYLNTDNDLPSEL